MFDPFGHTRIRRLERRLIHHYEATILDLVSGLTPDSYDRCVDVAAAPDLIRGYEEVKLENVGRYVRRLAELGVDTSALSR